MIPGPTASVLLLANLLQDGAYNLHESQHSATTTPVSYESWDDPPSSDIPHSHDQSVTLVPPGVFLSTTHIFAPCAIFLFTLKQLAKKTP